MASRPRILILGAGFGGLGAARKLHRAPAEVILVDRHDYHSFQPLIYQVATDLLDPQTVAHPIRSLVQKQDNLSFSMSTVSDIDLDSRTVSFEDWDDLTYDHLVVALGATVNYFGTEGAQEHAFPMYTVDDAIRLKNHMLQLFEDSAKSDRADHLLDTVIVGGGPTGVEMAGALAHLVKVNMAADAPGHPISDAAITLVDHSERLISMFDEGMSAYAREELERMGVTIRSGESVKAIEEDRVILRSGDVIPSRTTIWAAGLKARDISARLSDNLRHGRVPVGPMLNLEGHPETYVIGDIAHVTDHSSGEVLPQLGSVALQSGEHVGRTIDRLLRKHKDPEPFSYHNKGSMATIGRGSAVAEIPPGMKLTGRPAFLMWGAVHLALLTGGDNRAAALTNWSFTLLSDDRPSRVLLDPDHDD